MKRISAKRPGGSASLLKLRQKQRNQLRKEIGLLSVFMEEWYWQNTDVKENVLYKDPGFIQARWTKIRHQLLGGPGYGDGMLQESINEIMDNILVRLKQDIPYIQETDYFAYTYFIAGFDNRLVAHLLELPSEKMASTIKSRLKDQFLLVHSPYKFEYLEILPYLPPR